MNAALHPKQYYRLPWSLNDNVLGWLEPTKKCNLYCEGCYSENEPQSHKTLDQVRSDMEVFTAQRRVDSISIAGGDPLTHPRIADIVRMVREEYGLKPVINTNGLALTPEMLSDLHQAGVHGFTFHVDSSQRRPGWKDRTEVELNALRLQLATMVAEAGGLSCAFNATVFRHTLDQVPALVHWARDHIDIVHSMVFILFRTARSQEFDYFAHGERVGVDQLAYYDQDRAPKPLTAPDVVARIREADPAYEPAAYLGGTRDPDSMKWLLAGRLGQPGRSFGYVGRRYMEMVQVGHHLLRGRYLAYGHPALMSAGRGMLLAFSPFDRGVRRIARRALRRPLSLRRPLFFQSILVIQPLDMMAGGEMNMCDGCPDMTVHNGELVWSCRLDEQKEYGCFLTAAPRRRGEAAEAK